MTNTVFNPHRITHNKERARLNFTHHDFLHRHAAMRLHDRLFDICKPMTDTGETESLFPVLDTAIMAQKKINTRDAIVLEDVSQISKGRPRLDAIVSNLALHHINHLPNVLSSLLQQLKPDGFLLASMLGGETLQTIKHLMMTVESDMYGGVAPRIAPMIDIKTMGMLLQKTGFTLPVVDDEKLTVSYAHITDLFHDLRGMGEGRPFSCGAPYNLSRRFFDRLDTVVKQECGSGDGRFDVTFHLLYIIGWRAHENQQKPQKRGSATQSLKEVLSSS